MDAFGVANIARAERQEQTNINKNKEKQTNIETLLEPLLDIVQHLHWDRSNHDRLAMIVLEYKNHVKVLQMKLDTFKVNALDIFKGDHKWRLNKRSKV